MRSILPSIAMFKTIFRCALTVYKFQVQCLRQIFWRESGATHLKTLHVLNLKMKNGCCDIEWKNHRKLWKNIFIFVISCISFFFLLQNSFEREDILKLLENNILHAKFAGADVCGNFTCFGSVYCDIPHLKLTLNKSSIRGSNNWLKIDGLTTDIKRVTRTVVINVPLADVCNEDVCNIKLSKKLFSTYNYQAWICKNMGFRVGCDIPLVLREWKPLQVVLSTDGRMPPKALQGLSPPLTCVSPRLADQFLRRILGTRSKGSIALRDYSKSDKEEMLFTGKLSPATAVQRMFPHIHGWLLEHSLGSCGMVTVTGNAIDQTLFQLYDAPWKIRLDMAIQVLDMAHYFSENDSKFMLLLHRLTPHDIGRTKTGKLRIANSDNMIVVDVSDSNREYFKKPFQAKYEKHRFDVNEENICSYNQSDINYYAACRHFLGGSWKGVRGEILEGGLLHDPIELGAVMSEIFVLLDLCSRGQLAIPKGQRRVGASTRRVAAAQLRKLLASKRECSEEYRYRYPECELFNQNLDVGIYSIPTFELKWLR